MAGINLVSAMLVFILLPLGYFFSESPELVVISVAAQAVSAALVLATYWLARHGRLAQASLINVLLASGVIIGTSLLRQAVPNGNSNPDRSLYYLLLVIVYAAVFMPLWTTVRILAILLVAILITPFFQPQFAFNQIVIGPFNFILFNGIFLIFVLHHYKSVERERIAKITLSEARYRLLFEHSRDIVYLVSFEGSIIAINPAIYTIAGWQPEELIGKFFGEIVHPDDHPLAQERFARRVQGLSPSSFFELRILCKNGEYMPMEFAPAVRLDYADLTGVLGSMRDVRERKQADEQRLQAQIEQEQAQLVGSFITAVSHDFRTSLSNIENNRYLISRAVTPPSDDQIVPRLSIIRESVDHMRDQISNLELVSTLVNLRLQPDNLNHLIQSVVGEYTQNAEKRQLALRFTPTPDLPDIPLNADKLSLALRHLVHNAITHTPEGGRVDISTRLAGDKVEIVVADTGVGIPPEQHEDIFDLFYRGDSARSVRTGGVGVGLSIVRMAVKAHRGYITLRSAPGQGSAFTIVLPLN